MRTSALVAALLAGAAFAAPAGAATPPPAVAYQPGVVLHTAPSPQSAAAATPGALPTAPSLAPALGDTPSSDLKPAPSWVPRIKENLHQSNNWSGYEDDAIAGSYFEVTYSRWTEPNFTCDARLARDGSLTGQWIGMDGTKSSDPALEQDGTIEGCSPHGKPYLAFFWETIPGPPHYQTAGRPGDTIEASVTYQGNNEFQFVVVDETTGETLNVTKPCDEAAGCPLASTEAIAEWPGNQLRSGYTLTRYGAFPFYNFAATNYYPTTGLTYQAVLAPSTLWTTSSTETTTATPGDRRSRVVQKPGGLFDDDRAFFEYWRHAD